MLPFILAAIYLLTAIGVAYLGRRTLMGPMGTFLLALVLTPPLVFILVLAFARRVDRSA